jgi:hypothetical protein
MLMDDCSWPADPLRAKENQVAGCQEGLISGFFIDIVHKDW